MDASLTQLGNAKRYVTRLELAVVGVANSVITTKIKAVLKKFQNMT